MLCFQESGRERRVGRRLWRGDAVLCNVNCVVYSAHLRSRIKPTSTTRKVRRGSALR